MYEHTPLMNRSSDLGIDQSPTWFSVKSESRTEIHVRGGLELTRRRDNRGRAANGFRKIQILLNYDAKRFFATRIAKRMSRRLRPIWCFRISYKRVKILGDLDGRTVARKLDSVVIVRGILCTYTNI